MFRSKMPSSANLPLNDFNMRVNFLKNIAFCFQSDFMQPKHFERAHLMKPVPQDYDLLHGPNNTNIPKVTHYREQFTPFTIKSHTKSFKMNQVYEPPTERFMAQSVYKSNYTGRSFNKSVFHAYYIFRD